MSIRDEKKVRMPTVGGQFYDANPLRLRRQLMELEAEIPRPMDIGRRPIIAAILPHAGYMFSLRTAFKTLCGAAPCRYRRIILICPTHNIDFNGVALSPYDAMRTPFGDASVDQIATRKLAALGLAGLEVREDVHRHEHALEVQLPLLQYFFGAIEVLPLVCGRLAPAAMRKVAAALSAELRSDTLFVISSDFCHYGDAFGYKPFEHDIPGRLRELDGGAIDRITARDPDAFVAYCAKTGITICGASAIALFLYTLDEIDAGRTWRGELVDYTTSGEITGSYAHCVSYAGIHFREV